MAGLLLSGQIIWWGRGFPRRLLGEGSRWLNGIAGEAQSNWHGCQWEQMWAHHSQWEHAGGNAGPGQKVCPGVRVVEACDLSLLGAPLNIQGIPVTLHEKREALERITSKLELLNQHQSFVLLKNTIAIPKLQYVLRASPAYLCREECRIFDRALFGYLGRVANVSLEGDACNQAGFPVSFGVLDCRRERYNALPSFLASMNSVGELVETILQWRN